MTHLGDITKIDWFHVPPVDVVTGGSPCQDLSVAGKRAGLAGERSGLYMEQIRCVKELRQADEQRGRTGIAIRPRYMVLENVPGAFSSNGGEDFRAVLEEAAKIAQPDAVIPRPPKGKWTNSGAIMGDGWSIAWRVHNAQFWGVAQRRRRISVVCDFGGLSAPEILFERKGLSGDSEPCGEAGQETAGAAGGGVEGAIGTLNTIDRPAVYDARGNGSRPSHRGDGYAESDVMYTLNSTEHHAVCVEPTMIEMTSTNNTIVEDGISPTLTARMGTGGNQVNAVCVGNGQLNQVSMLEQANTLDTMHDQQAVMVSAVDCRNLNEHQEVSGTLQCKQNGGYSLNYQNPIMVQGAYYGHSIVRRLTPLEAERLQGYPDGWTDIGEWTDSKGKRHKAADSPRYKALGNSIALPFWFWLLRRISAQYIGPATLGSLFDGISGFCYVWARCNGSKSCLWASEIEEFPIAVCKRHFGDEESGEVGDILEYL